MRFALLDFDFWGNNKQGQTPEWRVGSFFSASTSGGHVFHVFRWENKVMSEPQRHRKLQCCRIVKVLVLALQLFDAVESTDVGFSLHSEEVCSCSAFDSANLTAERSGRNQNHDRECCSPRATRKKREEKRRVCFRGRRGTAICHHR